MGSNSFSHPTDTHGARTVIDFEHHEIHEGDHYTAFIYDADLDATSTFSILMRTPATGEMHMTFLVSASLGGVYDFQEGVSCTGGGAIVAYNNHRQSSNTASLTLTSDPTVTTAGTVLYQAPIGTVGNPARAAGGSGGARQEWILKQSTDYVLKHTSGTADSIVSLEARWYEES